MSLDIKENKKLEWLKQGGTEDELKRLGFLVKGMAEKAMEENIAYKEVDDTEAASNVVPVDDALSAINLDEVTDETVSNVEETESQVPDVEEPVQELEEDDASSDVDEADESTEEKEVANVDEVSDNTDVTNLLSKVVTDAIDAYHETVVSPLIAELKELKVAEKDSSHSGLNLDLELPAAAIAAQIKARYAPDNDDIVGDTVTDEELKEKELKTVELDSNSSHMLSGI